MKNLKKFASVLLALVMVLSMATTVFAADETNTTPTYTIEVNNNKENISINGITYSAYKLFNVTYDSAIEAHSYTITEEFKDFSYTYTVNDTNKTVFGEALINYIATLSDNAEALDAFAEAALEYATENNIAAAGSAVASNEKATIDVTSKGAGYYLIAGTATTAQGQTVTAACSLDTTNPTATVTVKADAPAIDKVIVNADDNTGNGTSVNVGDTVNFKLTSKVPSMTGYETYKYIVHDTMSAGLTFNDDVVVKIGENTLTQDTDYTVAVSGQSFTITIADLTKYTEVEGAVIEITYSANLNNNALTTDVETNKVKLEYSNNPNDDTETTETPEDVVYVYDFDIIIDKYAKDDTEGTTDNTRLAGAEFVLYKKVDDTKKYYKLADNTVTWIDAETEATVVTTNDQGKASFTGLEAGTYYLHETKAPDGYNQLKEDVAVTITATYGTDGTLTTNTTKTGNGQYSLTQGIENSTGTELPETGGIGTTIFYVVGGLMVLGAAVLLITRKRMNAAN